MVIPWYLGWISSELCFNFYFMKVNDQEKRKKLIRKVFDSQSIPHFLIAPLTFLLNLYGSNHLAFFLLISIIHVSDLCLKTFSMDTKFNLRIKCLHDYSTPFGFHTTHRHKSMIDRHVHERTYTRSQSRPPGEFQFDSSIFLK